MLAWGRRQDCDLLAATIPAVLALLPSSPIAAAPVALSEAGVVEGLMRQAGLSPTASGEVGCAFIYPDAEMAWRAIASAGLLVRAVRHAGEDAVKDAVLGTLGGFTRPDGTVVQNNRFRWVTATRA
jgi:hypothetical protein